MTTLVVSDLHLGARTRIDLLRRAELREPLLRAVEQADEVVLLGEQGDQRVLAEEWARRLQTINYEITCGISSRVPRGEEPG